MKLGVKFEICERQKKIDQLVFRITRFFRSIGFDFLETRQDEKFVTVYFDNLRVGHPKGGKKEELEPEEIKPVEVKKPKRKARRTLRKKKKE